jgi:hypothetical protein
MSRIFGVFLFSEPHEADVMLAKLHVERDLVTSWVAVENAYTQKGEWKGNHLRSLLAEDERFAPFRDRLTVISLERQFVSEFKASTRDRIGKVARQVLRSSAALRAYKEMPFHYAAMSQREAATEPVRDLAAGNGWVIVTDIDEMVDGSTVHRRETLEKAMSSAKVLHLPRRRFVYDFDNVSMAQFRHVPMIHITALKGSMRLFDLRQSQIGVPTGLEPLAYEYSYCFSREVIARKLATFSHVDADSGAIDRALECNHGIVAEGLPKDYHWYEKMSAEQAEHPTYVAERMDSLKTNVVAHDYHVARARTYPDLFTQEERT